MRKSNVRKLRSACVYVYKYTKRKTVTYALRNLGSSLGVFRSLVLKKVINRKRFIYIKIIENSKPDINFLTQESFQYEIDRNYVLYRWEVFTLKYGFDVILRPAFRFPTRLPHNAVLLLEI